MELFDIISFSNFYIQSHSHLRRGTYLPLMGTTGIELFLIGIVFYLPAYLANATPVFLSGYGRVDFGSKFVDGHDLLGKNKTILGTISGILIGGLTGLVTYFLLPDMFSLVNMTYVGGGIGLVQGIGAMFGDLVGSFTKRRFKVSEGRPFIVIDQIDFILFAMLFSVPFIDFPPIWLLIIPLTIVITLTANAIAYKLGLKQVWW